MAAPTDPQSCGDKNKESDINEKLCQLVKPLKDLRDYRCITSVHIPLLGACSYSAFSVNVLGSNLYSRLFGEYRLLAANCLFFNSVVGTGLYVYNCKHIAKAPSKPERVLYSAYASLLFNFGSVLLWGTLKVILLPERPLAATAVAVGSSILMIAGGKRYLQHIDSLV